MTDSQKVATSCRRVAEVRSELQALVDLWLDEPELYPLVVLDDSIAAMAKLNELHSALCARRAVLSRARE